MTKTQIAKALREAAFAPNVRGPLKVVADVGNLEYYIRRAMESLTFSLTALTADQQIDYLDTALSLTALAKVTIQNEMDKQNQGGEVCSPGDSVQKECVSGGVHDNKRSNEGAGCLPEKVQPRPQIEVEEDPAFREFIDFQG